MTKLKTTLLVLSLFLIFFARDLFSQEPLSVEIFPKNNPVEVVEIDGEKYILSEAYLPNRLGKSLMTPTGWGAYNKLIFLGGGLVSPQRYSNDSDAAIALGMGLWNPYRFVGVQLSAVASDVSEMDNYSFGLKVHRYLKDGTSLSIGSEHLFHDSESDAPESFYIVLSHACQKLPSGADGFSKLHYSVGAGVGRYSKKSDLDRLHSKGKHGTYVFGNAAYELFDSMNLIIDWSGTNLNAGLAISPHIFIPLGITIGVGDLTSYSGDGCRFIFAIGTSFML